MFGRTPTLSCGENKTENHPGLGVLGVNNLIHVIVYVPSFFIEGKMHTTLDIISTKNDFTVIS